MSQILTLLKTKKSRPVLIKPNLSLKKAASLFKEKHIRAAIISHNGKHVDGLLTERDIVHGLVTFGAGLLDKTVAEIMTDDVVTCTVDAPLAGLMAQMYALNIRNIPVVSETDILGIVTMRDLIGVRLTQVQTDADAMRNYISNGE